MKPLILPLILLISSAFPANSDGWALGGYDVVAYNSGQAVPGRQGIVTMWQGKMWQFASEENRNDFEANPRKFIPEFNGLCPVALSEGRETQGNPRFFMVIDGQLYLLRSNSDLRELRRSPEEILAKARQNWGDQR